MKRSKPLRPDPEKVREWQQRVRERSRERRAKRTLKLSKAKAQVALERSRGRCVVCGGPAQDPHHVLPKGKWPHLADVAANIVWVCRRDHDLHERAMARIPRQALSPETLRLARREGLMWYIEATYPTEDGWAR